MGSFPDTAREAHLDKSGINNTIKALEHNFGCRVFDRLSKKFALANKRQCVARFAPRHREQCLTRSARRSQRFL